MHILIYSPAFHPRIGGLENVVDLLASGFTLLGETVTVITETPAEGDDRHPFRVVRQPRLRTFLSCLRECDVYLQANVSLWGLIPPCLVRKPWIATHHGGYPDLNKRPTWRGWLKKTLSRWATLNIAVSHAVARYFNHPVVVISNPYDDQVFRVIEGTTRDRELVFLGRLVSDKGADLLLDALAKVKSEGLTPGLTIIGSGPELDSLQAQSRQLGLEEQVEFCGPKRGEDLVRLLNSHRIMVVPSTWMEPFGIVALEGIACGCAIIGSSGGGLPEAIGPCGVTFPSQDSNALAASITALLRDPTRIKELRSHAKEHLLAHHKTTVAKRYLDEIHRSLGS